ncbi:MAG: ParB/RepB/Spo0J family partition protein [Clostridia bacterium]|nr:ParB/RepB/Spo0J family partition protein [Clostridia bacterium]
MTKKTGLGKGLDALFSNTILEDEKEEYQKKDNIENEKKQNNDEDNNSEKIHKIKITEIEPNKDQPRRIFNSESIDELAESIKKYGVIQPIIVSKKENYYEIIAGERRWRASKKAGLEEIPCIIRESEEKEKKEIALIENIQREDLNPIEKARSFRALLDEYGMTQAQLAETLGISRSALTNTVRLLNLDPRVIELALDGKLSEGHCRSLLAIEELDKQYEFALQIIENGDSVREIERKVKNKKQGKEKTEQYESIYRDIEDKFQGFFGTKVKLNAGKKKGKIIIEYVSNEDLERILELLDK